MEVNSEKQENLVEEQNLRYVCQNKNNKQGEKGKKNERGS
jgi:hypothetical protein